MREKELRLALVCYGGISLAIYMHGVTKEVWHLVRASRAYHSGLTPGTRVEAVYVDLFRQIESTGHLKLRVLADIIAGASAGGINGIFLARAIATGQSLDPLTELWLKDADVDSLLDPDARPLSAATKFWAVPLAGWAMKRRGNVIDRTVGEDAQAEVRAKLSRFVRARWFEPPFGGETFSELLLDAFDAMQGGPKGPALVPTGQPVDLFVSVTDFAGHSASLALNSPPRVTEQEHRLVIHFRQDPKAPEGLDDVPALAAAARATASFPGAFPPFMVGELDRVLQARKEGLPYAMVFLDVRMPPGWDGIETAQKLWEADPDLQIVLCTAYSDYSWQETVAALGRTDRLLILKKPFDRVEVCQLASALTEKWNLVLRERQSLQTAIRAEMEARAYAASLLLGAVMVFGYYLWR